MTITIIVIPFLSSPLNVHAQSVQCMLQCVTAYYMHTYSAA